MEKIDRILIAADFSPSSSQALDYAIDLAVKSDAELRILFVEVIHGEPFDKGARDNLLHLVREQLSSHNAEHIKVDYDVERDFAPAPAIIRYADTHEIDLIVLGTHGRRGIRAFMIGSVAQEVVRLANCPVLTVRASDSKVAQPRSIRHILVPFDFSDHSRAALGTANMVARLLDAELELLHIVEDRFHPAYYGPFFQSVYDVEPDIEARSVEKLEEEANAVLDDDVRYATEARSGYPAHDISEYAEQHGADLIVMATHGLTGVAHFFMGSVAERTVRSAKCPVLTVKTMAQVSAAEQEEQEGKATD